MSEELMKTIKAFNSDVTKHGPYVMKTTAKSDEIEASAYECLEA
ncbi:hypothetical protein [Pleionea sp. CnH1-48]|nr:hypothetical protein [Pleionea sp. CnH1-48]